MNGHRFGKHLLHTEARCLQNHESHKTRTRQQQHRFNHLYPSGRQHSAEQHIRHHQNADNGHCRQIIHAEQQLNQLARADNLRNQVQHHHQNRTGSGQEADRRLLQTVGHHVGKGKFAQIPQPFSHQEQHQRPTDQKAGGINQAVIPAREDHGGNPEERRRRHKVARNRQTVLKPRNSAAGRVKILGRFVFLCRPLGDKQRGADENKKHHHRWNIQRTLLHLAGNSVCCPGGIGDQAGCKGKIKFIHFFPSVTSRTTSRVVSSKRPLAT